MLGLLRAAYPEPTGTMAYFNKRLTFSSPYRGVPLGYSLYVGFAGFWCTPAGTLAQLSESGVFINVDVNSFENAALLMSQSAPSMQTLKGEVPFNAAGEGDGQYTIAGRRVFLIPVESGQHRGVDHYAKREHAGSGDPPHWQWFVIRKPDVPLVIPVTRRDYVQQFRSELGSYTARELDSRREWARQSGDGSGASQADAFAQSQGAYLRAVDDYLKNAGEDELARPVFEPVTFIPRDTDNPEVRFREGDRVMAWLNPAYMDPKVPHHVPQFIVIQLSARGSRAPWETHLRERFSEGLDFDALKALIG